MAAEVSFEEGLTKERVSGETNRATLARMGGRLGWVVGFLDETWWSRLARPALNSWSDAGEPMRLVEQFGC